jgi:hypothetical protein
MRSSTAMRAQLLLVAVSVVFTSACGAGTRGADSNWTAEQEQTTKPFREVEELGQGPISKINAMNAWVGVRHDLGLPQEKGVAKPRCSCLAVEVGFVADPKFEWHGEVPKVGDDVLAVAISGAACPQGGASRASISAVDREGDNVLVEVEEIPDGRPIASGAIIPKPGPKGSVYVRPRTNRVRFARSLDNGTLRCRVD